MLVARGGGRLLPTSQAGGGPSQPQTKKTSFSLSSTQLPNAVILSPQAGQQSKFLSNSADICIYGGAAGGGKTYGLLLEPMRHLRVPGFSTVIFRRTYPEITNPGGLWDTSQIIYRGTGARSRDVQWNWPTGVNVKFSHLQHEDDVYSWQGSQVPLICIDELTHFSEFVFWYLLSRNRSACGVKPYFRATCNPDPDHWLRNFIGWWIDEKTGFPIPERDGAIRWMVRKHGKIIWADKPEDLPLEKTPDGDTIPPKSVSFVRSTVYDNRILLSANPEYLGNLTALPEVERKQLLDGNWNIRRTQGSYFQRHRVRLVDSIREGWVAGVRGWDLAATEINEDNKNPDRTAGVKILKYPDGRFLIADVRRLAGRPADVQAAVHHTALHDTPRIPIVIEQDPGAAGVSVIDAYIKLLAGFAVSGDKVIDTKNVRWLPLSAQWENGNVDVLRAPWNEDFFRELEALGPDPDLYDHDDQGDAAATAFRKLTMGHTPRIFVA